MNKKPIVILLIIMIVFSCGSKQPVPVSSTIDNPEIPAIEELSVPTRAEQVMRALSVAYKDLIEEVEFRNDDWAILLRGTWYYYASGRILPEERLENAENFRALSFYNYPAELPPWVEHTNDDTARFRSWTSNRRQTQIQRSNFFLDDLWQASNRRETESRLVRMPFLGRTARVHYLIQDKLALVETRIKAIAEMEPEVQAWINSIGTMETYGWRNIADTQSRSYHSYGLAIDLLPRVMGRRQTYWLWTSQYREDWWNVSYAERYHPPDLVINAFETYGFVWGGKWPLFDTMHFEYRPEILALNGLLK